MPALHQLLTDQPPFLPEPRRLVPCNHVFRFNKPECPYCGGQLFAQCEEWTQEPNGLWLASSISVDCDTEPGTDHPFWEEWWRQHTYMPYAYMLPLEQRILRHIRAKYRFELDDIPERT